MHILYTTGSFAPFAAFLSATPASKAGGLSHEPSRGLGTGLRNRTPWRVVLEATASPASISLVRCVQRRRSKPRMAEHRALVAAVSCQCAEQEQVFSQPLFLVAEERFELSRIDL